MASGASKWARLGLCSQAPRPPPALWLALFVSSGCGAPAVDPAPAGAFEISTAPTEPTSSRADEECGALVSSTSEELREIVRRAQPERLRQAALDLDRAGDVVMGDHGFRWWAKEYAALHHAQGFVMRRMADAAAASNAAGRDIGAGLFEALVADQQRLVERVAQACGRDPDPSARAARTGLYLECPFPTECARFEALLAARLDAIDQLRFRPTSADTAALLGQMAARLAQGHVESARMEGRRRVIVELVERLAGTGAEALSEASTASGGFAVLLEYRDAVSQDCRGDLPTEVEAADRSWCEEGQLDACARVVAHATSRQTADRLELAERYCAEGAPCACAAATRIRMIDEGNPPSAFVALEAHCAEGRAPECFLLAHHLATGQGVPADPERAQALFVRSCGDVGGELSCASVALPLAPGSPAEQAMNRACDQFGTHSACVALGREPRASP